jgi:galactokinase
MEHRPLPDLDSFLGLVGKSALFARGVPIVIARAPGRLDVMGGIADYSGSLVLQLPIREATFAALQRDDEPVLRIVSLGAAGNARSAEFAMPMGDFPTTYDEARAYFSRDAGTAWVAYAAGTLFVLMREKGVAFTGGARILISSEVPEGKGVSSSAALEVAVMQAVAAAFDVSLESRELAILCQKVENRVVGAPCGVMDQMTSAAGKESHLLALLCQPAEVQGNLPIPADIAFWAIDSGVRHSVSGADYGSVRIGAFMGYRILADLAGLDVKLNGGLASVEDPLWRGYLANVTPSLFEQNFARRLPERMLGADFQARYGATTDPVTRVDPRREYAVRVPAAHPVRENFRVKTFAILLGSEEPASDRSLDLMGELMYQSHAAYSACGLGSGATDRLVELVRQAGPSRGLYGAKITGGGSGGAVAVLGRADAEEAVRQVAKLYGEETGKTPFLFRGSSPGAAEFGTRLLNMQP